MGVEQFEKREQYLNDKDFEDLFGVTKKEFNNYKPDKK